MPGESLIAEKVFDVLASDTIKDIGNIVDEVVTSEEERATATIKLTQLISDTMVKLQDITTERLRIDMQSDSKFTKLIRPAVMTWVVVATTILAITDGNFGSLTIGTEWIDMFKSWGSMVFMFYFGSRGVEKVMSVIETQKTIREEKRLRQNDKNEARLERIKLRAELREERRNKKNNGGT